MAEKVGKVEEAKEPQVSVGSSDGSASSSSEDDYERDEFAKAAEMLQCPFPFPPCSKKVDKNCTCRKCLAYWWKVRVVKGCHCWTCDLQLLDSHLNDYFVLYDKVFFYMSRAEYVRKLNYFYGDESD